MKWFLMMLIATLLINSACSAQKKIKDFESIWEPGKCYVIPKTPDQNKNAKYLCIVDPTFEIVEKEIPWSMRKDTTLASSEFFFKYNIYNFNCSDSMNYTNHVAKKICKVEYPRMYKTISSNDRTMKYRRRISDAEINIVKYRHLKSCDNEHIELNDQEILEQTKSGYDCNKFNLIYETEKLLSKQGHRFNKDRRLSIEEESELSRYQSDNKIKITGKIDYETIKLLGFDITKIWH